MLRGLLGITLLLLLPNCAANRSEGSGAAGSIFREVSITPNGQIVIGELFRAQHVATPVRDDVYRLRDGAFGGAERITVHTDSNGVVTLVEFLYDEKTTFRAKESAYVRLLGEPSGREATEDQKRVFWLDESTMFSIVLTSEGLVSRLVDLQSARDASPEAQEPTGAEPSPAPDGWRRR